MTSRSIMWFRRDLRLRDNPALAAACAEGEVLPLFVLDPAFEAAGAPRRALLHDCLAALDEATGGALVVRHGDPVDEIPALADEIGADTVFVAKDFAPYGRRRDEAVADALRGAGRKLRGVGSPYAVVLRDPRSRSGGAPTGGTTRSTPHAHPTGSTPSPTGCPIVPRSSSTCRRPPRAP